MSGQGKRPHDCQTALAIVCDTCGYQTVETHSMKADDPCPECEQGGMMFLRGNGLREVTHD